MLTRGRAVRVEMRPELAALALPLPLPLVLQVLLSLPVDQRLLAALVSRAFRAAVADPSLWRDVSMAPGSGVSRASDSLLLAVARKARGQLVRLDVSELGGLITRPALLSVLRSNAGTLRDVRMLCAPAEAGAGAALLRASACGWVRAVLDASGRESACASASGLGPSAPAGGVLRPHRPHHWRLSSLAVDLCLPAAEAPELLLRGGPLRVRRLLLEPPWPPCARPGPGADADGGDAAATSSAAAAAASLLAAIYPAQPFLSELLLEDCPLSSAGALASVVGNGPEGGGGPRLTALALVGCALGPASLPAVAWLLRARRLRALHVDNGGFALLPPPGGKGGGAKSVGALCAALRASRPLASLALAAARLWDCPAAGGAVVGALAGHPTLAAVALWGSRLGPAAPAPGLSARRRAAGAALASLLLPQPQQPAGGALASLDVSCCSLGDDGLRAVARALRGCAGLAALHVDDNAVSAAFALRELLPAVAANSSLRLLRAGDAGGPAAAALARAEALVAARPRGGGGAAW